MSCLNNRKNCEIKICRISRNLFQCTLFWPEDGSELNPGRNYKIKIFTFFLLTSILMAQLTIYFSLEIHQHEKMNIEEIVAIIASFGSFYMAGVYSKSQQKIALLLRDLSDFSKYGKPPGFEWKDKQLNFFAKLITFYAFTVIAAYSYMQFLKKESCKKFRSERGLNGNHCGLIGPLWIPFNIDYFPTFHLWMLYGFLVAYLLLRMPLHISFNTLEIVQHIILRIEHLRNMILKCFDKKDYKIQRKILINSIFYHRDILDLSTRLNNIFLNVMFGHFVLTGTICACLEKQIVEGFNAYVGILHFIGWILALFLGCHGGQHLLNASEIIPEALWNSRWYMADAKLKKDFLIISTRSLQKMYIQAGPFGVLSYTLFVSVLKASYSIFCVLSSSNLE